MSLLNLTSLKIVIGSQTNFLLCGQEEKEENFPR